MTSPTSSGDGASANADDAERGFLGWRVAAAAFAAQFLFTAVTFSSFGVFVIPISEAFDAPRGRLSLGFSIAFLAIGATGPLVGHWIDRGYVRVVMLSGVVLAGLGLFGLSNSQTLLQLGICFCGLVAIGASLFGMTSSNSLVANWFIRRRGLALGIAAAGATVASFIGPPLSAYLIDTVGWRGALMFFGVTALVIGLPIFALWAIARPEQVGQRPDGQAAPDPTAEGEGSAGQPGSAGWRTFP